MSQRAPDVPNIADSPTICNDHEARSGDKSEGLRHIGDPPPSHFFQESVLRDVSPEMWDIFITFASAYDAGLTLADFCEAASRPLCLSMSDLIDEISNRTSQNYWRSAE